MTQPPFVNHVNYLFIKILCLLVKLRLMFVCLFVEFFSGPGEIRVSFDYNHSRQSLHIYVGEIKDVKLPAGTETIFSHNAISQTLQRLW